MVFLSCAKVNSKYFLLVFYNFKLGKFNLSFLGSAFLQIKHAPINNKNNFPLKTYSETRCGAFVIHP